MATSHSSVLAGLVWLLTAAIVVPWLAFGESSIAGCKTSCGGVDIPFPFGMGPDHCSLPGFEISCTDTGNGVLKPFKADDAVVEVLNISLEQGEAQVLHPISFYCYDAASGKMVPSEWLWDLTNSRYSFSSTANMFTVVGRRALAYIGNTRGNASAMYQTGCVAMCFDGKMSLNSCSGMGCCQTAIPNSLQYYHVWFDHNLNTSAIDDDPCSFAVLMDSSNFTSSTSSSNNQFSPSEFNNSRGGQAPVVLDWSIGHDDCATAQIKPGYACVGNSFCSDAASGRGYGPVRLVDKPAEFG